MPPPPRTSRDDPPPSRSLREPLVQGLAGHLGDTERREQLANDRVGLHLAAFEIVHMGANLFVHELSYGVAHGKINVCPFQHAL